tara:strand:+ start:103 stop:702 length:600 start_codon:yes stop_codon:yes gene_type:complete
MASKITLNEHLQTVDQNSSADEKQINSLCDRIRMKFRDCGFVGIWKSYKARGKANKQLREQSRALIREYVEMILETQDYRCTHWLKVREGELNGVWNRPGQGFVNWKREDIIYEIDHVIPENAGGEDKLENYQFLSSNANQFVKCSLTYEDLLRRIDISASLKDRIRQVLDKRSELFSSDQWLDYLERVLQFEKLHNTH